MTSYIQRFINSVIYNNNNGIEDRSNRERDCRTDRSDGKGIADQKGKPRTCELADKWNRRISQVSKRSTYCRRNIQSVLKFQVAGRKDKAGSRNQEPRGKERATNKTKAQVILPSFLFSNNVIVLLQSIDDICFQINPILLGALFT